MEPEVFLRAAQQLFAPGPLVAMLVMLPFALLSGATPGGGLPVAVVLLGFAGFLDPWITVTALVFYLAASDITEPVPSILLGIPGSSSAQATVLDGYPMAQKGQAGIALGASYTTTLVGGLIGAACLLAILPFVRELLRQFGSAEFFILSLMAVIAVAIVSAGAFIKGMLTAAFSMAIAMIGFSPVTGQIRTDFGLTYLWDGIGILPVVVGLFAIPEMIALVASGTPVAKERLRDLEIEASKDVRKGMRTALQHKWLMVRSSLIGVAVGIMPGVGGSAAHWIAYAHARQTEKGARQSFGIGDVRGVIASDSANNSVDGGQLIPTLFFAIPGSAPMAILLAIFILSGITPGPTMLTTNLDMTISLIYIIVLANIIVIPIMLVAAPLFIRLTTIQPKILAPVVIAVVTLAAFQATNSVADLVLVLGFAALGLYMKRYGWPRTPMLIAVVLAEPVEKFLWLSINTIGWSMFARPQFIVLFVILVLMILGSMWALKGGTRAVDDSA